MGLVKRRLYKPERKSARKKGVLYNLAPIGCVDASAGEVARALFAMCKEAGIVVGRGSGYDSLRDEYTVVGKNRESGKVQDFKIAGAEVATLIKFARRLNRGRLAKKPPVVNAGRATPRPLPGLPGAALPSGR